jgi:hypothetical protein
MVNGRSDNVTCVGTELTSALAFDTTAILGYQCNSSVTKRVVEMLFEKTKGQPFG